MHGRKKTRQQIFGSLDGRNELGGADNHKFPIQVPSKYFHWVNEVGSAKHFNGVGHEVVGYSFKQFLDLAVGLSVFAHPIIVLSIFALSNYVDRFVCLNYDE